MIIRIMKQEIVQEGQEFTLETTKHSFRLDPVSAIARLQEANEAAVAEGRIKFKWFYLEIVPRWFATEEEEELIAQLEEDDIDPNLEVYGDDLL